MSDDIKSVAFGICKFCGQTQTYDPGEADNESEGATLVCNCPEGGAYRTARRAHKAVEEVGGSEAAELGFQLLTAEQMGEIKGVCERIAAGEMQSAQYSITGHDVIGIRTREKDGRIVVKRVRKVEIERV